MAKKVTIDTLDDEIKKILNQYQNETTEHLAEITKAVGRKGVQALKNERTCAKIIWTFSGGSVNSV